jgi:hypothetical protein
LENYRSEKFEQVSRLLLGENMKKNWIAPRLKSFPRTTFFHMVVFYWFIMHFSHSFSNSMTNLRPNIIDNIKKN